jgi:hypothetical protein
MALPSLSLLLLQLLLLSSSCSAGSGPPLLLPSGVFNESSTRAALLPEPLGRAAAVDGLEAAGGNGS